MLPTWRWVSPGVHQKPELTHVSWAKNSSGGGGVVQGCVKAFLVLGSHPGSSAAQGGFLEQVVVWVPQVQTSLTVEFTLCYLTESVYCPLSEAFRGWALCF